MSDYDDMVSIAKIKIAGRQFSRSLATERTARLAAEARVKELTAGLHRIADLSVDTDKWDMLPQQIARSTLGAEG